MKNAIVIYDTSYGNKPFASFDTEIPNVIEKGGVSASEKIAKKFSEKSLKQVLPVLKTDVLGIKGPLKEGEIENTKNSLRN